MTLVLAASTKETIWLLTDRRLSVPGRRPKEDACKAMVLETTDGVALLGYAGLGATALGTQPADWMSNVLRGRNIPLEQSLRILEAAVKDQLPFHLSKVRPGYGVSHDIVIPAFVRSSNRIYSIDLALSPNRTRCALRLMRHQVEYGPKKLGVTPTLVVAGTGGEYLQGKQHWARNLRRLLAACDRLAVGPMAVADYLARLNYQAHLNVTDKTVGPRCIVVWRHVRGGNHKGGGGSQYYTGTHRDDSSPATPLISCGLDMRAITNVLTPHLVNWFEVRRLDRTSTLDKAALDAAVAKLPDQPDDKLV